MAPAEAGEPARVHVWVTGRVQGVGFRAFVQQAGTVFELAGWVRNVGYEQVEAVAEGSREVLLKFIEAVSQGPRASKVEQVRTEWETPTGEFHGFGVKYSI
jgi:acylphosphatase